MACVIYLGALTIPGGSAVREDGFIARDWHNPGDNLVTLDRFSGLEWLDLTATTNRSFDNVVANLETGGDFEGWQLATASQVFALLENAGVCRPEARGRNVAKLTGVAAYNDLIGAQDLGAVTTSRGIVSDLETGAGKIAYLRIRNSTWEWSVKLCRCFPVTEASVVIGTYLQRPAESEQVHSAVAGFG